MIRDLIQNMEGGENIWMEQIKQKEDEISNVIYYDIRSEMR